MKTLKLFPCPECKRRFEKLHYLNLHISHSGHNEGKLVSKTDYLIGMDLQKSLFMRVKARTEN